MLKSKAVFLHASDCQESSSLWEWDAHKEGAFYDVFFVVGIGYLHQVAAIGMTLLAIVLHVAISVKQSRQHGILDRSLASGVCKIASYAFDSRDSVIDIVCIYRSRNNKSDVKLIESQSHIKVN